MTQIRPHDFSAPGGGAVTIYADTAKLQEFFPAAAARAAVAPVAYSGRAVRAHTRARFPGDPNPTPVAGHSRSGATVPRTRFSVLPGDPFWCENILMVGGKRKLKPVQFTLEGDFSDLALLARSVAPKAYVLRSPGGTPHDVVAAT